MFLWIFSLREWSSLSKKSFIWTIISVSLNWFFDSFIQLSVNYFAILRFSVCFCLKKVLLLLQNQSPVVIFADRIFCFSFEAKLLAFLFWQLLSGFKGHLFFLLVISLGISFPMHCHCQFHCQWISYWPRVSFRFPALWLVERVWVRTPVRPRAFSVPLLRVSSAISELGFRPALIFSPIFILFYLSIFKHVNFQVYVV